jgi:hypothetical protein
MYISRYSRKIVGKPDFGGVIIHGCNLQLMSRLLLAQSCIEC